MPVEATAFAHRKSPILVTVAAFNEGIEDRNVRLRWVENLISMLYQGDDGAYVNFLGDEGIQRVHAAYPYATWRMLPEIKRLYDPTNLFRMNQNIPPS